MSLGPLRRWEQRFGALSVPPPLAWVALIAAFLGFGVLLGRATGSKTVASLAANRAPLKVLVAAVPAPSVPAATIPAQPAARETETPSPAPVSTPEEAKQSSKSPMSSTGSSSGSKEFSSGSGASPEGGKGSSSKGSATKLAAIKHVFVVMLDDEPYATAFGPASPARYLAGTLEKQGETLVRYYGVAHEGLADGLALLSGQGPNEATAANCPTYSEVAPASAGSDGQVLGQGCVYPASTHTLIDQLSAKHLTWKAYIEGIDEGPGAPSPCAHPVVGAADPSVSSVAGGIAPGYQTWRNPFVYFDSIVRSSTCASNDIGMSGLARDLKAETSTASVSYIAPGPCDDGSPTPCAAGKASGMTAANAFLRKVVPQIFASKAYKKDGMLAITVDNAPSTGEYADSSSCCGQPRFLNLPVPSGAAALSPPGGGQVGLLLLSPFIKKGGGLAQETYNHYSLLATIEQIFGLGRLGYAALPEVKPFSASLFGL